LEHQGQVPLGSIPSHESFTQTQVVGPGIGAAAVASDEVGVHLENPLQRAFLKAIAYDGCGSDYAKFWFGH
jgi:hypothetical protein